MLGESVGGITGSIPKETRSNCSAGGQEACITTDTYKSMDLTAKDGGGALDVDSTTFSARVKSASTFEFWDELGTRHTAVGDADIVAANVLDSVDIFGVNGTAGASPDCSSIPFGTWILVPGNPVYGTKDFCVMKYEAKCSLSDGQSCTASMSSESPSATAANTPWVWINQQDAITECASLGKGYHLISNDEWMTIATNVASVASNWSNGAVGNGQLIQGHTDDSPAQACDASISDGLNLVKVTCSHDPYFQAEDFTDQRTHTLSNGQVIWDLSGNVSEWTSYFNDEEKPTPNTYAWYEYTQPVVSTNTMPLTDLIPQIAIDNSWNSSKKIGGYYPGVDSSDGGLSRGGRWDDNTYAGVFAGLLSSTPTSTYGYIGFRCAVAVP